MVQVGLDGIRMLDPDTSRTLRIYPLETVTRWDVSNRLFLLHLETVVCYCNNIYLINLVSSLSGIRVFYLCLLVQELG
jgi:hypothetical protein